MRLAYSRAYQKTVKVASRVIHFRQPTVIEGNNSIVKLPTVLQAHQVERVLIVTDRGIVSSGVMTALLQQLDAARIVYTIYDETVPNPTVANIEAAYAKYTAQMCNGILAFGGGSPMDCAKGVAARIVQPEKSIAQMKGLLKVRKEMPPFFAVPTTAGTGSEATAAAVISNPDTQEKYAVMDPVLIPHVTVLDPLLTVGLPPHLTATTGLDALTHAVEAYIGKSNTKETRACSIEAVQLIFQHLPTAYRDGANVEARAGMQRAAYLAGVAFTRAYVGYVHAVAHTLGGFYGVPHGLANAVLLPHVLTLYGESAYKPLAELADAIGLAGATEEQKAKRFIAAIGQLNEALDIPKTITGVRNRDVPVMVGRAQREAVPLYPVPRLLSKDELFYLYQIIQQ